MLLLQNLSRHPAPIVNVMWTLPLEVEMYIVLPVIFFFARREQAVWPLLILWLLIARFCMIGFPDANTINLATVIPMFLPGIMAYVGFKTQRPRLPAWLMPLLLAAIIASAMQNPTNRKSWYVALVLGLTLPLFQQLTLPWLVRASHETAKYSYGIYLSHPFALVLGMYVLRQRSIAVQVSVEVFTIALVSIASYHLLEEPMVLLGKRVAARAEVRYEKAGASLPA